MFAPAFGLRAEVPENENCTGLRDMCGGEGVAQAFPELCAFL